MPQRLYSTKYRMNRLPQKSRVFWLVHFECSDCKESLVEAVVEVVVEAAMELAGSVYEEP